MAWRWNDSISIESSDPVSRAIRKFLFVANAFVRVSGQLWAPSETIWLGLGARCVVLSAQCLGERGGVQHGKPLLLGPKSFELRHRVAIAWFELQRSFVVSDRETLLPGDLICVAKAVVSAPILRVILHF